MAKLFTLTLALFAIAASGQTTYLYTVPVGDTCTTTVNGCTLHNLTTPTTAPFPGGATPFGYFAGGSSIGAEFAFQLFQGQNAAAGATYCIGSGLYTQTPRSDLGANYVQWQLDCVSNQWTNGSGAGELGNVGSYRIVANLIAHWYKVTSVNGRWRMTFTVWAIDEGTVAITAQ